MLARHATELRCLVADLRKELEEEAAEQKVTNEKLWLNQEHALATSMANNTT